MAEPEGWAVDGSRRLGRGFKERMRRENDLHNHRENARDSDRTRGNDRDIRSEALRARGHDLVRGSVTRSLRTDFRSVVSSGARQAGLERQRQDRDRDQAFHRSHDPYHTPNSRRLHSAYLSVESRKRMWGASPIVCGMPPHRSPRRALRSSCALSATTTVLADIRIAATAGYSRIPWLARTPPASGIATTL